jgi:hypothetical protein
MYKVLYAQNLDVWQRLVEEELQSPNRKYGEALAPQERQGSTTEQMC